MPIPHCHDRAVDGRRHNRRRQLFGLGHSYIAATSPVFRELYYIIQEGLAPEKRAGVRKCEDGAIHSVREARLEVCFVAKKKRSVSRNPSTCRRRNRMAKTFRDRIQSMNEMYKLPVHDSPHLFEGTDERLLKFKKILLDEVHEIDEIVASIREGANPLDIQVALADLLGDVIVYCRSEAMKYGLPLEEVLDVIMDSNESKLGADGKPIYDENGKFLKGPTYWKPEPRIKDLLAGYKPRK